MARINISINDELVERLALYSEENYMSRSGVISLACTQFLNAQDSIRFLKDLSLSMRKIADTGTVDKETEEKMKDLERLAEFMTGGK